MKMLMFVVVVTVFSALLTSIAVAQSPREQLQQLTLQLQQIPTDQALRERIIKLGAEIKPMPAVPEDARRSFVEGVNIVKLAKDVSSQKLAIGSFTEALKVAPWWGDAYYNLAVAQELTGQLNDAERTLKWFLLSNPGESEAREAQDRIYGLSAKRKLATAEAGAKQEQADRELVVQAQRFVGDWFRDTEANGEVFHETVTIRRDEGGNWQVKSSTIIPADKYMPSQVSNDNPFYDIEFVGRELRLKQDSGMWHGEGRATYKVNAALSADGNTVRFAYAPMPLTARQEVYVAGGQPRPLPHVKEYMKQ